MTVTRWFPLLLLVPWLAMAQEPGAEPETEEPETAEELEAPPPPPLIPAQEPLVPRERFRPTIPFKEPKYGTEPRLPLELVGGSLGLVVGAMPGLLVAKFSFESCAPDGCESITQIFGGLGGLYLALLGMPVGMGVGIFGAGSILEGEGQFGWTMGGVAAGALLGYGISKNWGNGAFAATSSHIFTASLALVGGIVSYEVSHHLRVERRRKRHEAAALQVMPVVTHTGRDIIGGLAGRF
ncbi:hypothetical protein LZ198_13410 [Myxococcus sp. K15C18031901]|uniref:hypothetical protein n=1 Tax=Myxococcus dinghuensis TaxID=2906761 RepID=UPI0020A6EF4D|nr:hypothetical protein [Myxococcus dinghuensis]MCP3099867.1 hypothetical protein [Myxococcus dinghuensis]